MELINLFKNYLFAQKKAPSKATVKNYTADIRHFVIWFESKYNVPFEPTLINTEHWKQFQEAKKNTLSSASLNRHLSSLRKFFAFVLTTNAIQSNPFDINAIQVEQEAKDPWKINEFKDVLKKDKAAKLTIKNYLSDIQQFLSWIESNKNPEISDNRTILPLLNGYFLEQYKTGLEQEQHFSQSSIKRKISSIKKYIFWIDQEIQPQVEYKTEYNFPVEEQKEEVLATQEEINEAPFEQPASEYAFLPINKTTIEDAVASISQEKTKEIISDTVVENEVETVLTETNVVTEEVAPAPIEESVPQTTFEATTALPSQEKRTYQFLEDIKTNAYYSNNVSDKKRAAKKNRRKKNQYSKIPPVRLFQKLFRLSNFIIDVTCVLPLKKTFEKTDYLVWMAKGKPVFGKKPKAPVKIVLPKLEIHAIENIKAAYETSKENVLSVKKSVKKELKKNFFKLVIPPTLMRQLKHRPAWYHKYHSYPVAHYFHLAILVIFMSAIGFNIYAAFFSNDKSRPVFASLPTAPPKLLSFNGRLTQTNGDPITSRTNVRFAVYNSNLASGSALLWQEVDNVNPDKTGNVSVALGSKSFLDQNLFSKNPNLWLGVTVEQADELHPRQQLATTGYAANSETLQGMAPITQEDSGTKNVILALDSGGNLTMNDSNDHTFQATNGQFTLSGNTLVLATNPGSSSDVQLAPDGFGQVDIQKPIHNTSNYNNIASALGSVEVDDTFSILASQSGQSAFTLNQNGYGPLISASSSGVAKFTIDNDGSITSAGDLFIKGNVKSNLTPFGENLNLGSNQSEWNNLFVKNIYLDGNPLTQVWQENNDSIMPIDQSKNLLVGLTASTSANFEVVASTGAILTKNNITLIGSSSAIGTINNQTLQLGNPTTGAIALSPNNQTGIFVNGNGSVGIGTQNLPDATALHIQKDSAANSLVVADQLGSGNIFTGSQNGNAKFAISNNGDTRITGGGLCVSANNNCSSDNLAAGTVYATNTTVSSADLAENYISGSKLEPGDIIMPADDGNNAAVVKSTSQYQSQVLGVVSTKPGVVMNSDAQTDAAHPYKYPIALSGRVPVKVSIANGIVRTGDLLTSSATPGIAMKATKAGPIIGKALEDFSSETPGTVMAYISVSFGDPSVSLADNGNLNSSDPLISGLNNDQKNNVGNFIDQIANGIQVIFGNISAGMINAKDIAVDTLTIHKQLISPVANIAELHSNVIAPLSNTGKIALKLNDNNISIMNNKNGSGSAVATIDNQGNASFSGQLASNGLNVTHDATISGVLHASKIIADQIEGPMMATAPAQYITNITNIYNATPAATPAINNNQTLAMENQTAVNDAASPSGIKNISDNIGNTNFINIASYSADLSNVPSFDVQTGTFEQGLVSMGPTSLADTSITGQLSIGSQFVFADNSINVLGGDLELQPLKQGGIAIAGRQIYIDSNGNITANGNATFNGVLAANIIAPVPNHDLTMKLDNGNSNHAANLKVTNASNSAVFSVSQLGDIIASGAATINKLNFNIAKPAMALSDNEVLANGSAGVATVSANQTFVTIYNSIVTDKSLIYITPVGGTSTPPFLLKQVPNKSFTVGIEQSSLNPTTFNWLIVN